MLDSDSEKNPRTPDSTGLINTHHLGRLFPKTEHDAQQNEHIGRECSVQRFYEEGTSAETITWNDFASPALANPRKLKYEGAAFQVYNRYISTRDRFTDEQHGTFNGVQEYYVYKIRIQSPYIRSSLEDTFAKFRLTYKPDKTAHSQWPHRALFFSREKIAEVARTSPDEQTRLHCTLLGMEIEKALDDILEELHDLQKTKEITFRLLWTIFPRGSLFAAEVNNSLRALRVKEFFQGRSTASVYCECICFDGFRYGKVQYYFEIGWFEGRVPINKIPNLPVFDISPGQAMRERLLERGRKILNFQGIHYLMHIPAASNVASKTEPKKAPLCYDTSGDPERVVIDFSLYQKYKSKTVVEPLRGQGIETEDLGTEDDAQTRMKVLAEDCEHRRPTAAEQEQNRAQVLRNEENLLLLHPKLEGFSLATRTWTRFEVDHLHPIEFDPNIFKYVVHDKRTKDLLRTLAECHQDKVHKYDEFVEGKGNSLLILLTGESGTGKTLMAESMADHLKRPLLRCTPAEDTITVTIEDKGTSRAGGTLHAGYSGLPDAVRIAADWGAIMLYDDANFENDSFLYTFLRQVEYFKGIVFFTSNSELLGNSAVLSRAQIHLKFKPLAPEMRKEIWANFNQRLPADSSRLPESALEELSMWKMNGRQIKNAINMTVSWCRRTRERLNLQSVEDVIKLTCPSAIRETSSPPSNDLISW
ncbi:P-loop containing nucleoside triphosphate hydrolase protein [Hypoxylon sp. FL1857]|nr:P-loop containing nucleoside triphosphate hydrolase protein [Hypoxylon sp. FL1857]